MSVHMRIKSGAGIFFLPADSLTRAAISIRQKYGNGPIIFALGRHVYYKGFNVLIRAMPRVPATLLLGGNGPLTDELKRLASATRARVSFLGAIPEELLAAYYHASDVFCLPSVARTEAFGLVQAEAMACSKPIVNTALKNGVNELAPHGVCSLTVTPGNPIELADALCRLLANNTLARQLGETGRQRITSLYSVRIMVKRTLELYESLSSNRYDT